MKRQPPGWINKFLEWYCDPNLLDEIQGDVFELYNRRLEGRSKQYADVLFLRDVLGYFRWSNLKKTFPMMNPFKNLVLFRSFMKVGFRNITKYYVVNSISILGLSLALGICITALIFYDVQVNMDEFHLKGDRIYQITRVVEGPSTTSDTPVLLGPSMHADYPIIEHFTRIEQRGAYVKHQKDVFEENIAFVDPSFLQMFDFPMIAGNSTALSSKNAIVISYDMAKKYFAYEDPIGKELQVFFSQDYSASFVVTGVMDKYTDYASFYFDFYIPFGNLFELQTHENDWESLADATFILVKQGSSLEQIKNTFPKYLERINASSEQQLVADFKPYPLFELSERCHEIKGSVSFTAPAFTRISLAVIALMLLILAVFNFINISIASYSKRLKEIAVRKVIGSNRGQIVFQFFVENLLLCLFSFTIGVYLGLVVFTPGLNYLIPLRIPSAFSSISYMVISLSTLFLVIVAIAGIYPSYFISRFSSSNILRGIAKFKQNSSFSRVMLAAQFVLAFITIVGCFVYTFHSFELYKKDWGYTATDVLMVRTVNPKQLELIKNELSNHRDVQAVAVSRNSHVGAHNPTINYKYKGEIYQSVGYHVDENYHKILGLNLKYGRWFDGTQTDFEKSIIVNEAMVQQMYWKDNAIGQEIDHEGSKKQVIGVVGDFHYRSFHTSIKPAMFLGLGEDTPSSLYYLSIKARDGGMQSVQSASHIFWDEIAPQEPFVSMRQEDAFESFYEETKASNLVLIVISSISILLACLGLFGLFSFTIQRRLKEFSIRKVLGATPLSIVIQVSKAYLWIVLIAFLIGAPIGYLMINKLLTLMYPERFDTGMTPYIYALIITAGTILLTITGQILRAVRVNPTENLRGE